VRQWTFLTDHAHVLVCLAREPRSEVPELAAQCGLEPVEVARVLADLEAEGYVRRTHQGATTFAVIDRAKPLRHPVERHHPVGRLLDAVQSPADVLRERLGTPG
jgi:DNA-binding IclR family transcriptional regulator